MAVVKSPTVRSSSYFGLYGSDLTEEEKKRQNWISLISCAIICCLIILGYIAFMVTSGVYLGGKEIIKRVKK